MRLRVLIAPDKFKGTLSARKAAQAIARGWHKARPADALELLPISDGGDGFGEAMSALLGGKPQRIQTRDAAHRHIKATWWWAAKTKTAIIESAKVIGLAMLPRGKFHPFQLDTFGLGAVLQAAHDRGARQIIVGVGGSATSDGGFGLARSLGWRFCDAAGNVLEKWMQLPELATTHPPLPRLKLRMVVALDVTNPLLGVRGATRVYGPQKGMRPEDFATAERCLRKLASSLKRQLGVDHAAKPGAGAAGGLGFGLLAFCEAEAKPGFELFARRARLTERLRRADLVITGEGAIDASTAMGKGVGQLARLCLNQKIPCIGLGGQVKRSSGVQKMFQVVHSLTDFHPAAVAQRHPAKHLAALAERAAAGWHET